jgi:HAD superfamily hydrolase (TIGR01549 family)
MDRVLSTARNSFDFSGVRELTVEAGRPDTITQEKLEVMKKNGYKGELDGVAQNLIATYKSNAETGDVKPTCENLASVLAELKKQDKKLAVVTTDNREITLKCLKALGIEKMFDKIYTDDGVTPVKPDPYCVNDFCASFGLDKTKVIMVGDTMTDMNFAKNAGISVIGIAKSEGNRNILSPYAHALIDDPSYILELLD